MPGQYAAYDIFVDLDTEDEGDLLGDPSAPKSRVFPLHLNDGRDQFWRWTFWPRLAAVFRREQHTVLALHERSVKREER